MFIPSDCMALSCFSTLDAMESGMVESIDLFKLRRAPEHGLEEDVKQSAARIGSDPGPCHLMVLELRR